MTVILCSFRNSCTDKAGQAGAWHKCAGNLMHVQIIFQNVLNYHNWNSQLVRNSRDSDCAVCEKTLHMSVLLTGGRHQNSVPSTEVKSLLNLESHPGTCVLPICYPVRATFDNFKVSIAFSPSLKQSLIHLCCSLKSVISRYAKIVA